MKKKSLLAVLSVLALVVAFAAGSFAASQFTVIVNGNQVDVDVRNIDGSTYVPLRAVSEILGAQVGYENATKTVTITTEDAPQQSSSLKEYDVDISIKSGPMNLNVAKVTLDPNYQRSQYHDPINAVILEARAENTSDDKLTWYFTQGQIVLNTKEQVDTGIFNSDDIDGEFNGKVVKEGRIVFEVKSNLDDITDLRFNAGSAIDESWDRLSDEQEVHIVLE